MGRPSRFNQPTPTLPPSNQSSSDHQVDPTHQIQNQNRSNHSDHQGSIAQPTPASGPSRITSNSVVTGPTSALTSFLKEQGIRARNVNRFTSLAQTPSTSLGGGMIVEETEEQSDDSNNSEPDSDHLDDQDSTRSSNLKEKKDLRRITNDSLSSIKRPSSSKNQITSTTTSSSTDPKGTKPKGVNDDHLKPMEEDSSMMKPKPGKYSDRKPGLINRCVECGKRFTVTRYTIHSSVLNGQLCDHCSEEFKINNPSGNSNNKDKNKSQSQFQKPSIKRRKTTKNQIIHQPWSESSIQTLQMACISVIARNTDSIEALGNVGNVNLEKICQIVCKHRELTPSKLPLFIDAAHSDLKLFDCIHLRDSHLKSIASFCPHLERLTLNLCGHMTGEVLETYGERLTKLRELELFGAYLIRKESWLRAIEIWNQPRLIQRINPTNEEHDEDGNMIIDHEEEERRNNEIETIEFVQSPQILGFRLKQSPRFDFECVKSLVSSCKNLTSLHLNDLNLLDDHSLILISQAKLEYLQDLAISNAGIKNGITGEALTNPAVIKLLESVGNKLEKLDLSENKNLDDLMLDQGIGKNCFKIKELNLKGLNDISTLGISKLFKTFKDSNRPGLINLNLNRCIKVGNEGLESILDHSSQSIRYLDLNSVDELRYECLDRLARCAKNMISIDLSFVRDVDDFIIKSLLDHMTKLKTIFVYGNNRVSDLCPTKRGVIIKGQERAIVI